MSNNPQQRINTYEVFREKWSEIIQASSFEQAVHDASVSDPFEPILAIMDIRFRDANHIPESGKMVQERVDALQSSVIPSIKWVKADGKPEYNVGVLVFIPDEDFHITSGMWDISNKWVLLDEYRVPDCEVTHWMPIPQIPDEYKKEQSENNEVMGFLSKHKDILKKSLESPASSSVIHHNPDNSVETFESEMAALDQEYGVDTHDANAHPEVYERYKCDQHRILKKWGKVSGDELKDIESAVVVIGEICKEFDRDKLSESAILQAKELYKEIIKKYKLFGVSGDDVTSYKEEKDLEASGNKNEASFLATLSSNEESRIEQAESEIEIHGIKKLMYWTAKMTQGMINSGKSAEDVCEQIEKKISQLSIKNMIIQTVNIL